MMTLYDFSLVCPFFFFLGRVTLLKSLTGLVYFFQSVINLFVEFISWLAG